MGVILVAWVYRAVHYIFNMISRLKGLFFDKKNINKRLTFIGNIVRLLLKLWFMYDSFIYFSFGSHILGCPRLIQTEHHTQVI